MNSNNPFQKEANPHRVFREVYNTGDVHKSVLALEEHLRRHPEDQQGWRILGTILQEIDQDNKSINAFLRALELNPECESTLFNIGISCNNVLDELSSMMYLDRWLHVITQGKSGPVLVSKEKLDGNHYTTEDVKAINQVLSEKLDSLISSGTVTPQMLNAQGVVNFIGRRYEQAVENFNQALKIDNLDYAGWNKFGAALAHVGHKELSKDAYSKALDLKPNYMRAWVNMGHGFSNEVRFITLPLLLHPLDCIFNSLPGKDRTRHQLLSQRLISEP